MDIPTNEPEALRAGVQWDWRREDLSIDFPADGGWALKYWFKKTGASAANFSIDATASGKFFAVQVLAATTLGYTAGDYTWVAIATKAAELREIDSGRMTVLPRYDQVANLDDRSHARKMLEQIQAAMLALNQGVKSYTIGTRQITYRDMPELIAQESRLKWLVKNEDDSAKIAAGLPNPRNIGIRFNR